jgi:hypothetical protein
MFPKIRKKKTVRLRNKKRKQQTIDKIKTTTKTHTHIGGRVCVCVGSYHLENNCSQQVVGSYFFPTKGARFLRELSSLPGRAGGFYCCFKSNPRRTEKISGLDTFYFVT